MGRPAMAAASRDHENRPSGYHIGMERPKSERPCAFCPAFSRSNDSASCWPSCADVLDARAALQPGHAALGQSPIRCACPTADRWAGCRTAAAIATARPIRSPASPGRRSRRMVLELWHATTGVAYAPEACLINYYGPTAKLGLHRDQDEDAKDAPILSISLGDTALFRLGGPERKSPTRSVKLAQRRPDDPRRARRGTGTMGSTASCPAPASSCRRAAGSTSPCGG